MLSRRICQGPRAEKPGFGRVDGGCARGECDSRAVWERGGSPSDVIGREKTGIVYGRAGKRTLPRVG